MLLRQDWYPVRKFELQANSHNWSSDGALNFKQQGDPDDGHDGIPQKTFFTDLYQQWALAIHCYLLASLGGLRR